jgi:iron complex outermembrane receptor protein
MNRLFLTSGAALCTALGFAQITHAESHLDTVYQLDDYVVSAGPGLRSLANYATPINIINAEELARESGGTLGALLDWKPGISASAFTAGASRPVLRGFDGPRVRILNDGIESLDASDTSPDHGVAAEPLLAERIEVLRGPSTLLYGGSAIGGVVNVIGREIPRYPGNGDLSGAVELRGDTVSNGQTALGYAQFSEEQWAVSVTALKRKDGDYEIPKSSGVDGSGSRGTVENSFAETDQFSIGGAWFIQEHSRLGFAYSRYESLYGVPGEDVTINLERDRFDAELELNELDGWVEAIRLRAGYTDYQHVELEGPDVGTVFEREGWELRAGASHADLGLFDDGIFGIQLNDTASSAVGDEAFTPPASTQTQAVFINEHHQSGAFRYELGARLERQDISAEVSQGDYNDVALSLAASAIWNLNESNSLTLSLQRSQRHPNSTELYARGPHLATSQYELGDAGLDLETVYGADLSFRSDHEKWHTTLSVFYYMFDDFIFAENLGFETDAAGITEFEFGFDSGEALDTYGFTGVDATFWGLEAEFGYTLYQVEEIELQLALMGDFVSAQNDDSGDSMPRTPPLRVGSRLSLTYYTWDFGTELRYAFKQNETAPIETETDGYTEWNLDASKHFDLGNGRRCTLFARASNLLDEEIRSHTSFLKDTVSLPGRNVTLGARFEF